VIPIYKCLDCENEFETPKTIEESHGFTTPPYEMIATCPLCNSENYKETYKCDQCGVYIDSDYIQLLDGSRVCENCYNKVDF